MTFSPDGAGTAIRSRAGFDFGRLGDPVVPLFIRRPVDRLADDTVDQLVRTLS
ncbi:hypothetical protein [Nocardioides sp. 503]|uniref:hypothetical protein n=1 Tax=Nocardioides sp. 503 TaxID=2508326 RepID=UPI00142FF9E6|nr:hypothetical protein [Nocardioides sp. 503]